MQRSFALASAAFLLACSAHAPPRPPPPAAEPAAAPPPVHTDVLVARARALRAEGDVEEARAQLEVALAAAPDAQDVRLELADVLVADGQELDRAAALLGPLGDDGDGRVELVRGRLAEARSDDAGAEAAYGAALVAGDDPDVRLRRALALERLGRNDEAIAELERLRALRPGDAFVRAHLADSYEAAARRGEAEAEFRWVAEAQPDRRAGWERLASFYERGGRHREARAAADRARAASGPRPERALRPLPPSRN